MCSTIISYLAEPIQSTAGFAFSVYMNHKIQKTLLPKLDPLPEAAAKKITDLFNELNLTNLTADIRFHQMSGEQADSSALASGCLIHRTGMIILSEGFATKITKTTELTKEDKFQLIHELGHVILNHNCPNSYTKSKRAISNAFRFSAYFGAMVGLRTFFPLGFFSAHLLSCGIGRVIKYYSIEKMERKKEFEADAFAAIQSPELAQGGLDFNETAKREYLSYFRPMAFMYEPERWERALSQIETAWMHLRFSSKGYDRFDCDHPTPLERSLQIQKIKNKEA
ncbi:MAG: M48 family metalloprotease [Chlamydiota bacterium]